MTRRRKKRGRRPRRPRSLKQYNALPTRSSEAAQNAAQTISRMRDGVSLRRASAELGIDPRTVVRYAGSALRRTKSGRYAAKSSDTAFRRLVVPAQGGQIEVVIRGSRVASEIGKRSAAQREFLASGDDTRMRKLQRTRLLDASGHEIPFLTDLEELERLGDAGLLEFESIYARVA